MLNHKPTVLVVDDDPINIAIVKGMLKSKYQLISAHNGQQALKSANACPRPDIILLDIMMKGMDGYEVCRRLKKDKKTHDIPIIFSSVMSASGDEIKGLELGAVDYFTKPLSRAIIMIRIQSQIQLQQARQKLIEQNRLLEDRVKERTEALNTTQDITILCMTSLAEARDNDTGNHIRRTQHYVKAIAKKLRQNPAYQDQLNDQSIELLFKSAPLHDIGKIGIPDHILLKKGKLNTEEFNIMKKHPTIGRDAIMRAAKALAVESNDTKELSFLRYAIEITYGHHEYWDGSGYPQGLSGEAIPLSARIMAIADVYDALLSKRPYKKPISHEEVLNMMMPMRSKHFDPDIFDAFLLVSSQFKAISMQFKTTRNNENFTQTITAL